MGYAIAIVSTSTLWLLPQFYCSLNIEVRRHQLLENGCLSAADADPQQNCREYDLSAADTGVRSASIPFQINRALITAVTDGARRGER